MRTHAHTARRRQASRLLQLEKNEKPQKRREERENNIFKIASILAP